jgi:wobble nucleotide-excising tRNase
MLKKFVTIKNVGNFKNHAASGDTELRRLTLLHAENARGKTTLCAVLRSLRDGDSNRIMERKTLDSLDAPYVKLLFDDATVEFKNGAWPAARPHLEIFDGDFITENVYSGDVVTHDHKKNLCRIVLGQDGVQLATKIDELDVEEREAANTLNTARADVLSLAPTGMSVELFINLPVDLEIDEKIEQLKKAIAVAENSAAIGTRALLSEVAIPGLPSTFLQTLAKTIEGVSADATAKVREHMEKRLRYMRGPEGFLALAVNFADDGICPVCAQPLENSPVFAAMQDYFSLAYRAFQEEIQEFSRTSRQALGAEALLLVQKVVAGNATLIEFWSHYTGDKLTALAFDEIQAVMDTLRAAAEPLIDGKLASPLDAVEVPQSFIDAVATMATLREKVNQYNARVRATNEMIRLVKNRASESKDGALKETLVLLEAQKKRQLPESVTVITAFTDAQAAKVAVEQAKETAREALDAYNATVIGAYHDAVNELLSRFGAGFKLLTVKVEYTGRTPRAAYTFGIRGKAVDPGNERTAPGTACFRNTLSAGDRSTLALAFFVAQLKNRADICDLIVVFDDPFTSLDSFRQHWTCCTIRKMAERAKQVIVLSHSLDFLRAVAVRYTPITLRALQIARHNAIDSHIICLDLNDATASQIEKDIIQLREYKAGDETDNAATIRCIRPVLENHIRTMAPDDCPGGQGWLGNFLGDISKADVSSPLSMFKPMYDDLDNLNSYTSPYAHDSGVSPPINPTELAAHVELTLELVGRA